VAVLLMLSAEDTMLKCSGTIKCNQQSRNRTTADAAMVALPAIKLMQHCSHQYVSSPALRKLWRLLHIVRQQ
jgi:hypothetical protein